MNDLLQLPFGPALILLAGSIVLRIFASPRRASILALLTLLPLGLTFAWLLDVQSAGIVVWRSTWWPLVTPELQVRWALDGWNWLALVLLALVGACAVLLTWRQPGKRAGAYHGLSLLLLAAASLTVVSDSLLSLSAAWVATDIVLVARARGGRPRAGAAPFWLEASGSLLVMVAIGITSQSAATSSLATAPLPAEALALLLIAAALRMAAYPLHLWLAPSGVPRDRGTQLLINGVGLATGAWLLGRCYSLGAAFWLQNPTWPPLLTVAVLAAGFAAWAGARQDRLAMLGSGRATWLWLTVALASASAGRDALGWGLVSVLLGLMLLAIGQSINEHWGWRFPIAMAALILAGVPLTPGMPARALAEPTNLLLMFLLVAANSLAVACVFLSWSPPASAGSVDPPVRASTALWLPDGHANWPVFRLLLALGLALVPSLLWGVMPARLAISAGFGTVLSLGQLLQQFGWIRLLGPFIILALGIGLAQALRQPETHAEQWRTQLAAVTGLGWVLSGLRWLVKWGEIGWRNVLGVVEGEGYLGWIVFFLALAWLIIRV
jgi:hypothetical protein